jgi:trimeric autotransporter adhesin
VIRAFRDVDGRLRDMRGRFITEGSAMTGSMNRLSAALGGVKGSLIPLASAATPLAAALAPIAVKAGAAGVAVAAFGVAVAGQTSYLSEASKAQDKYTQSVQQYGRGSKQAAEAQRAVAATLASMPQATARASVALSTLKDGFQDWSDGLAGFTMTPVEKSFTLLGQMLPRLTPMVQGASSQLDRLVTVAGGAMTTPGFDELSDKVANFSNAALKDAVDGIIHFSRALSEGSADGPLKAFMEYADQNGPALRETLSSVGDAVSTLVEASAAAGPGMLTLVTAAAQLVASLPPELVTVLMQVAVGLKLVSLAGAGAAAAAAGVQALGVRIAALNATSAAAGGGVAGLRAAFMSLGVAARASVVVAGIAAVAVAFGELGQLGRQAPPDIDKLATSLGQLGRSGKVSGEAARLFGKDLDGLYDSIRNITDPTTTDKIQQGLVKVFSLGLADSTPHSEAEDRLKGIDAGLTNLVRGGKADIAAAAFARLSAEYVDGGGKAKDFKSSMDGYAGVLADVALEQQLTADSMGFFGEAALATSAKLEAQQRSADGLRQSILALNDVNRSAYEAQIGFEGSLDALTESFKKHGATLDIDTEAGRANGQAMADAAKAQGELIATGLAAGDSLGTMTKKSSDLREEMMRLATEAFKGNTEKATAYVNTLLGAPSEIKTLVKLEREEAISGLEEVRAAVQATPGSKEVTVSTLNGAAIAALEAVGLKTRTLPDGRTQVYTANGQALGNIGAVSSALNRLNGKTATTYLYNKTINTIITNSKTYRSVHDIVGRADGGLLPRYADGDQVQVAPNGLLRGPGSGRSDDILAMFASGAMGMVSNTEFVVNAASTKKYLPLLEAINENKIPGFAKGGLTSGQLKGLSSPSDMGSLTSTLSDVRTRIKDKTSGGTETRLLRTLDSVGKSSSLTSGR